MNELRKEIERQFRAHGLLEEDDEEGVADAPEACEKTPEDEKMVVMCVHAPKGYQKEFAEDFKNLSKKWQTFLSEREENFENKICDFVDKIESYRWLDDIYHTREKRLADCGFKQVRDWLEGLASLDDEMAKHPAETLRAMAQIYGVCLSATPSADNPENKPEQNELLSRICKLEHGFHSLISHIENQQQQKLIDSIRRFQRQTDENGRPLHRYFDEVADRVVALLKSGAAMDVSEAYQMALWMHPRIREELIAKEINSKAEEAQKAQKAAFAPKGKAKAPERELTLREEIEKNMAAFMD